jgi:dTDP-4-amino-4,6-dideoxygalactose transaminase
LVDLKKCVFFSRHDPRRPIPTIFRRHALMIPLVNLQRQYADLKPEIDAAVARVITRQEFINGREVRAFTDAYLKAMGAPYGAACDNGTAAIELSLKALGIGPGDDVITVAHTFFATVEAILNVGATPVFVDIDPRNYTMDPGSIVLTPKTRALLPVHLYGAMADMTAIKALADKHKLKLIEDAAQAHMATLNGHVAGTIGDAGTFSFYPGKNRQTGRSWPDLKIWARHGWWQHPHGRNPSCRAECETAPPDALDATAASCCDVL